MLVTVIFFYIPHRKRTSMERERESTRDIGYSWEARHISTPLQKRWLTDITSRGGIHRFSFHLDIGNSCKFYRRIWSQWPETIKHKMWVLNEKGCVGQSVFLQRHRRENPCNTNTVIGVRLNSIVAKMSAKTLTCLINSCLSPDSSFLLLEAAQVIGSLSCTWMI